MQAALKLKKTNNNCGKQTGCTFGRYYGNNMLISNYVLYMERCYICLFTYLFLGRLY